MAKKVFIIGAGTAGLASAIRLQAKGFEVEVFEKNPLVGGRMYQLEDSGFKFDVGPTIVMMPEIYRDVFKVAGKDPDDYIPMQLLDPMYSIHFPDKTQLTISNDLTKLVKSLEDWSEEDTQGYLAYLADVYQRYLVAKNDFIQKSFRKPSDFYNFKSLHAALKLRTLNSAYSSISKFVKNEKLRRALSFQTLYIGISPFVGPSIYTIIPMIELLYGVWYIKGGMFSMTQGMEKLFTEMGGKIHLSTNVDEIVIEDKKAVGIKVGEKVFNADVVLCNADFPWAMKNLIKKPKNRGKYSPRKINKMEYSASSFVLYLGLKKKYKTNVHAIRFAQDFNKNIDDLFNYVVPEDPSFYMYSPSQIDESVAPDGKEVLYVLVPVPSNHKGNLKWGKKETKAYQDQIIELISKVEGFEDIKENIEVMKVINPDDFARLFNLENGATFGLRPTLLQSNYFRPQNKFKYVENLYFAGSSNHPGAGVPIVLTSAKLAVDEILKDVNPQ